MNVNLEILDCTIRDGGYVNNWDFDKKLVRETYRALSKSGVDYAELGYHGSEKYFAAGRYGRFRFSSAADINEVCAGIDGAKVALMVDHGKFDLADLAQYRGTAVKMIRSAFHKDKLAEALTALSKVKELGFVVSANLMGFVSYTPEERRRALALLRDLPIDYAYVADSYGSMFPDQVTEFFAPLKEIKHMKWGFHPHNNLQMSFANSLAAIKAGARIIDSSVFGMGRGAGNLPTEILLTYAQRLQPDKYNVIPVLNLIDRYYNDLNKEHYWGYNLPYMLSGNYGCHPDYARNLVERKEYDIEDIWNILEAITRQSPVGYKSALIEEALKKGIYGKQDQPAGRKIGGRAADKRQETVSYLDRHKGRDFLILANGPTLKQFQPDIQAFIDKYDPVVMGGNFLGGLFVPHYHAFVNKPRFVEYIDDVSPDSQLLIGQYIPENMVREYVRRDYEVIYYEDTAESPFDISAGVISANCRTVAVLLAGVAQVMGAKRLFIAGLDGYLGGTADGNHHYYHEKYETDDEASLKDKHLLNHRFIKEINDYRVDRGEEELHIITPTYYKEFYKGIKNYI